MRPERENKEIESCNQGESSGAGVGGRPAPLAAVPAAGRWCAAWQASATGAQGSGVCQLCSPVPWTVCSPSLEIDTSSLNFFLLLYLQKFQSIACIQYYISFRCTI